jgi:hypothetical protein
VVLLCLKYGGAQNERMGGADRVEARGGSRRCQGLQSLESMKHCVSFERIRHETIVKAKDKVCFRNLKRTFDCKRSPILKRLDCGTVEGGIRRENTACAARLLFWAYLGNQESYV